MRTFDVFHSPRAFHKSYCMSDLGATAGIALQNDSAWPCCSEGGASAQDKAVVLAGVCPWSKYKQGIVLRSSSFHDRPGFPHSPLSFTSSSCVRVDFLERRFKLFLAIARMESHNQVSRIAHE